MAEEQLESVEDLLLNDSFCEWIKSGKQQHHTFWEAWQADNPTKKKLIEEASQLVQQLTMKPQVSTETEIETALSSLFNRLPDNKKKTIKTNNRSWQKWAIAASLLLFITLGWLAKDFFLTDSVVYETAYGEIKEVKLTDGTKVVLQANSILKVPKKWENKRKVWLEGEAFFNVTAAPSQFVVKANNFDIEVLGTIFNVLTRAQTKRIVLQEGKIKLASPNQFLELIPNEMLTYETPTKKFVKSIVNASIYTAWTDNAIHLNNMDLEEFIRILEDNYGYTVQSKINTEAYTSKSTIGVIKISEFQDLLNIMQEAYDLKVEQNGQVISLLPK